MAEIVIVGQLGGGVARDGERQFVPRHATAIVDHLDERAAAFGNAHLDTPGAGIDGVFDQFLNRRSGAFDDFPGGDAVDHAVRQKTDVHDPSRLR